MSQKNTHNWYIGVNIKADLWPTDFRFHGTDVTVKESYIIHDINIKHT